MKCQLAEKFETTFECTFCEKAFATKDELKSHESNERKKMKDEINKLQGQINLQN